MRKNPRSGRRSRLDPLTPPSEIDDAPPVAARLHVLTSLSLRGLGRKTFNNFRRCMAGASALAPYFLVSAVRLRTFSNASLIAPRSGRQFLDK
jgi:hypothetical protein